MSQLFCSLFVRAGGSNAGVMIVALVLSAAVSPAAEISLHVSPSGSDKAAGGATTPLASPHRAIEKAVETANQSAAAQVKIIFHEGVYRIQKPLMIRREHVPPKGSLTICAADGARVVISGGQRIRGWKIERDGTWTAELPEVTGGRWAFRELFVDGQRRPRARHPNAGFARVDEAFPDKRTGFTIRNGDLPKKWTAGGELVFLHDWSISRLPVKSVDHAARRLQVGFPIGNRAKHYEIDHFEPHPRYFVENHEAFFDAAGEWLLDAARGVLRYKALPDETPQTAEVVAPLASALLVVEGDDTAPIRNVHVRGLHFEHCAWQLPSGGYSSGQATAHERRDGSQQQFSRTFIPAAVRFERAEDCSFTAGHITHVGTSGVQFGSRTHRCRLEDSVIEDVSGNGVNLGEDTSRLAHGKPWWKSAPAQAASHHLVTHNRIERCGQQFFGAVAVWAGIAHDLQITHNEIAQHPYTGISLGWMWNPTPTPAARNRVMHNHIHHVMQVLSDGGGVYTLGRQPNTQMIGNVIHDIPLNAGRAESNGMFLDEGSDQATIANNTIFNTVRSPLRFHKAEQMTIRNNTLVVPDSQTPPLRYNNTDPATIEQRDNRVLLRKEFDNNTISLPLVGPRN